MIKWRKREEAPQTERRTRGWMEAPSGVFRSTGDFASPITYDVREEVQSSKAIAKDVEDTSPTSVYESVSTMRGDPSGGSEQVSTTDGSRVATPHSEGSIGAMPGSYSSVLCDRDVSIYESTPAAYRLEPILTADSITSVNNGTKTTITIGPDPRINGTSTTVAINHEPRLMNLVSAPSTTTLVINSEPVQRVDKGSSTDHELEHRLRENTPVSSPSVSPLSRASSNRTTDTEHSSGTGSTFYLTGGVGSLFTPQGSTTKLINTGRPRNAFQVDTGWLPSWSTVFTVLSLVVGFGNIVRLPRVVALHGGGPLLVIYIAIMIIFGIPLVFLEIGLGQFCEEGTTKLWRAVPLFKGVGYVKILSSTLISIYYPILMTMSLFYMIWSAKALPFTECVFLLVGEEKYNHTLSGEDCLRQTFLRPPKDDGMWFGVNVALMFLIWAIILLCMFKNRQSFRLATYIVVVPVTLILVALLVENIVRDTSAVGIHLLFNFNWSVLLNIEVWYFATIQMFFSLHLGFGNIVTSAGRLYPQSSVFWTATLYVLCNLCLGIISVLVTFYYIGQTETDIANIKMPEVFIFTLFYEVVANHISVDNQVWAAFGYLTFVLAGLASMLTLIFTVIEAWTMELGKKVRWDWWQKTGVLCACGFVIGVASLLPYELELVHIFDHYVIGRMVIATTILELIGMAWIYGCGTLYTDFEFILGYRLNPAWKIIWWISPVLLLVVEIWSLVSLPLTGLFEEKDALWVFATGWTFYLLSWVIIIVSAIYQVTKQIDYNLSTKILNALKPSRKWGPVDTMYRHNWHKWRTQSAAPGERDYTLKRQGTKDYTHTLKRARSPQSLHFQTTLSPANTIGSNRGVDKLPYIIQDTEGHVCWRGTQSVDNVHKLHVEEAQIRM